MEKAFFKRMHLLTKFVDVRDVVPPKQLCVEDYTKEFEFASVGNSLTI